MITMAVADLEAEAAVLSAMMIGPDEIAEGVGMLTPDAFHSPENRTLFSALADIAESGQPIDPYTITARLNQTGEADDVSIDYLSRLIGLVPTAAHLEAHAGIVRDRAELRRLITAAEQIVRDAHQPDGRSAREIVGEAEARILALSGTTGSGYLRARDALEETLAAITAAQDGTGPRGVPSGIRSLDELTMGFHPRELVVIAARPSMGKTALALNCATHAAIAGQPVLVFSFEMGRDELLTRAIASEGRIDMQALRGKRGLNPEEHQRIGHAAAALHTAPLFIDDADDVHVHSVTARARRAKKRDGIAMIVVDYLQLMEAGGESRRHEIDTMTRAFKRLARSLDVPVLLLSQLSRGPENRNDKRPQLSDLRESGGIEQDADVVIMLYRPDYYLSEEERRARSMSGGTDGLTEILVKKQRNGPTGTALASFHKASTRFDALSR